MIVINDMLEEAYGKWKDKDYIYEKKYDEYVPVTYGEFIEKTQSLARRLLDKGLKNKKVLLYGRDSIDYMIADLALTAYVGVSVNINKQTKEEELCDIIEKVGIDAVMYDREKEPVTDPLKIRYPSVLFMCIQHETELSGCMGTLCEFEVKDPDVCSKIVFSSGTTSNPKGVMLSLRNLFVGWEPLKRRMPLCEDDIDYMFVPMHHTYGNIFNFLYSFLSGLSIYLCSGTDKILQELNEVNPTAFCGVPWIYEKICRADSENFRYAFGNRIRYLVCGGAKFDPVIRRAYKESGLPMYETYALTEVSSSLSLEYRNDDDFYSGGTIFENIDVKIINSGKDGTGEIVVKGDNVFLGYVNNPELTNNSFTDDGYFITGDYGYIKDRKIYVTGRRGDVISGANGENVFPKEIEKKLKTYSSDIIKLQAFLNEGKVNYRIFIIENSDVDIEEIIRDYNSKATNKDRIKYYSIIYTDKKSFKE